MSDQFSQGSSVSHFVSLANISDFQTFSQKGTCSQVRDLLCLLSGCYPNLLASLCQNTNKIMGPFLKPLLDGFWETTPWSEPGKAWELVTHGHVFHVFTHSFNKYLRNVSN